MLTLADAGDPSAPGWNAAGVLSAVAPAKNNGNWLAGLGEWV